MRHPQPALRHRHRLALLPDLEHVLAVGVDVAQREEQIHVLGGARYPERRGGRAGGRSGRGFWGLAAGGGVISEMPSPLRVACDDEDADACPAWDEPVAE